MFPCIFRAISYVTFFTIFLLLFSALAISFNKNVVLPPLSKKTCLLINSCHPNPKREATYLVDQTINFIKRYGLKSIYLINRNDGRRWYSGQFYVTVINWDKKTIVASPARQSLTGMYLGDIGTTLDGKSLMLIAQTIANAKGNGVWQEFYWRVPMSREVALYKSYGKLFSTPNSSFIVMSGYYDAELRCSVNPTSH